MRFRFDFDETEVEAHLRSRSLPVTLRHPRDADSLKFGSLLRLKKFRQATAEVKRSWKVSAPGEELPEKIAITDGKKTRLVYRFSYATMVYHSLLAQQLAKICDPIWSRDLYSYRRGYSNQRALKALKRTIRGLPPRVRRGSLFFLKADVKKFSERARFDADDHRRILESELQLGSPEIQILRKLSSEPSGIGLYAGSPLANLVQNLMLMPLDRIAHAGTLFYGRYNDDFLTVTQSAEAVLDVQSKTIAALGRLGLELNLEKTLIGEWTRSGATYHSGFRSVRAFDWLGFSVDRSGSLGTAAEHLKSFRDDFRRRLSRCTELKTIDQWISAANVALGVAPGLACDRFDTIHGRTDNRVELRELDLWVCRTLANRIQSVTGTSAPISPSKLFANGLYSFVAHRNQPLSRML